MQRCWRFGLVLAVLGAMVMSAAGQEAVRDGATPAAAVEHRPIKEVMEDLNRSAEHLQKIVGNHETYVDAAKRAEAAPKVIPLYRQMIGYANELSANPNAAKLQPEQMAMNFRRMMVVFGDEQATSQVQREAESEDAATARRAKLTLLTARWLHASQDPATQNQILDELEAMAQADSTSDAVTIIAVQFHGLGAASGELRKRAAAIVGTMQTPAAAIFNRQMEYTLKLREHEGQPITIEGLTHEGKQISTAQWRGQVVLIDFWATWCAPCLAEMPELIALHEKYQPQGYQVLGISSDLNPNALRRYLQQNPLPWPTLFDEQQPGDHAIAREYGIEIYPTKFLIDRKGILRSVNPDELEKSIQELLAESGE